MWCSIRARYIGREVLAISSHPMSNAGDTIIFQEIPAVFLEVKSVGVWAFNRDRVSSIDVKA